LNEEKELREQLEDTYRQETFKLRSQIEIQRKIALEVRFNLFLV